MTKRLKAVADFFKAAWHVLAALAVLAGAVALYGWRQFRKGVRVGDSERRYSDDIERMREALEAGGDEGGLREGRRGRGGGGGAGGGGGGRRAGAGGWRQRRCRDWRHLGRPLLSAPAGSMTTESRIAGARRGSDRKDGATDA